MKKGRYPIYLNAFANALNEYKNYESVGPAKVVFYGVKVINSKPEADGYKETLSDFQLGSAIIDFMSQLKPTQFINIFPIEKDYKGHKTEMKDYFYTRDYINTLDQEKPIGENILEFLWEYMNWEVAHFNVEIMGYMSYLRRNEGYLDPLEEFMATQGMETPNTFKNSKGKTMYVRHGKPVSVEQSKPGRFKLIK